ncbi:hypothetical protein [Rubrivivax rivuli]|uniref:Uncharacterized protein n=1 Tax=Rubrivivax rivuli TaxID=1862385 RepID=A0A437RSJ3_9BURK|nr:hypothetical protein [Rubrivivax rivuli]RVU49726.1 hypothetical protein EOE66_04020 [Rubrivivax rivuli]
MIAKPTPRPDFADTLSVADGPWAWSSLGRAEGSDARELMASVDAADRHLLRLVLCAAAATLVLALATSLGA